MELQGAAGSEDGGAFRRGFLRGAVDAWEQRNGGRSWVDPSIGLTLVELAFVLAMWESDLAV